jgi:hypothetical protein
LPFLDFKAKGVSKDPKGIREIRVIQGLKDHRESVAGLEHKESVASLEKAEKAMIQFQDNIQAGHTIKMDQTNLLF